MKKVIFQELEVTLVHKRPQLSKFKLFTNGKLVPGLIGPGAFTTPLTKRSKPIYAYLLHLKEPKCSTVLDF